MEPKVATEKTTQRSVATAQLQILSPAPPALSSSAAETQIVVMTPVRQKSETEERHEDQLSEPKTIRSKYLSAAQAAFGRSVVQKLMLLNPVVTREQVRAFNDEEQLEQFKKSCCLRLKLRPKNYTRINTVDRLNATMRAIKTTLKFVITSASYLNLLSRRLIRCTRIVQAFCVKALKRQRLIKKTLLDQWTAMESDARRLLKTEIEYWASRSKSASKQRSITEMWEMYMKCWLAKDDMAAAIQSSWVERRDSYVMRFRQWKAVAKANLVHSDLDTITMKRRREHAAYRHYPKMGFTAQQVTLAELIAHHDLMVQRKIGHSINATLIAQGHPPRNFPKAVGDLSQLQSPVSFYHALLQFDRKKLQLVVFLYQLGLTGHLKLPPGPTAAIKEQAKLAQEYHNRWEANGILFSTEVKSIASRKGRKVGRTIGADGQPIGTLQMMREASEAQPDYLSPVTALRWSPPTSMSERRARGQQQQRQRENGGFTSPSISPTSTRVQSAFMTGVLGHEGFTASTPPAKNDKSPGRGGSSAATTPTTLYFFSEERQQYSSSCVKTVSQSPQPSLQQKFSETSPSRLITTGTGPDIGNNDSRLGDEEATDKRWNTVTTLNRTIVDLNAAEKRWKATEGSRMLRRPQSARQAARAVVRGSEYIATVFSDTNKKKGGGPETAADRILTARRNATSPRKKKKSAGESAGLLGDTVGVDTAEKGTSCSTTYDGAAENFYRVHVLGVDRRREEELALSDGGTKKPSGGDEVEAWDHVRQDPDKARKQLAAEAQKKRVASLRPTIARRRMATLRPVAPVVVAASTAPRTAASVYAPRRNSWELRPSTTNGTAATADPSLVFTLGSAPRPHNEPVLTCRPLAPNLDPRWSALQ